MAAVELAGIHFAYNYPIYFVSYDDLMSFPREKIQQLAHFFDLDQYCISRAAAVVDGTYHHAKLRKVKNLAIAYYYQLLCPHCLSATDYLNYRNSVLAEMG